MYTDKHDNFALMDVQTNFTYKKTTFRDNHICLLNYLINICVNAKLNTLYLGQYLPQPKKRYCFGKTYSHRVQIITKPLNSVSSVASTLVILLIPWVTDIAWIQAINNQCL